MILLQYLLLIAASFFACRTKIAEAGTAISNSRFAGNIAQQAQQSPQQEQSVTCFPQISRPDLVRFTRKSVITSLRRGPINHNSFFLERSRSNIETPRNVNPSPNLSLNEKNLIANIEFKLEEFQTETGEKFGTNSFKFKETKKITDQFKECNFITFRVTNQDTLGITLAKLNLNKKLAAEWINNSRTNYGPEPNKKQFAEACQWEIDISPARVKKKEWSAILNKPISVTFGVDDRAPNQKSNPRKGKVTDTSYGIILQCVETWDKNNEIISKIRNQRLQNIDFDHFEENQPYYTNDNYKELNKGRLFVFDANSSPTSTEDF